MAVSGYICMYVLLFWNHHPRNPFHFRGSVGRLARPGDGGILVSSGITHCCVPIPLLCALLCVSSMIVF